MVLILNEAHIISCSIFLILLGFLFPPHGEVGVLLQVVPELAGQLVVPGAWGLGVGSLRSTEGAAELPGHRVVYPRYKVFALR
jgi:hypothetical protein